MLRVLLCLLCLDASAALRLTQAGGSRRDALYAFAAATPLLSSASCAHAGTVGAAPTPEDEAKFDAIFQEKLKEKEKTFKALGYELEEEDKQEARQHPRTVVHCGASSCLPAHVRCVRRAISLRRSSSTCYGRACAASRPSSSARAPASRRSRGICLFDLVGSRFAAVGCVVLHERELGYDTLNQSMVLRNSQKGLMIIL